MQLQAEQDSNAMTYSKANAVNRTVSKSSSFYKSESWDLIDAAEKEDFEVEEIAEDELPENLRKKSKKEIESYIKEKSEERKLIQEKIQELNNKRLAFVKKNSDNKQGGLENALLQAIKDQGKKKSFSWE